MLQITKASVTALHALLKQLSREGPWMTVLLHVSSLSSTNFARYVSQF